jgi:hypothetical protein
MPTSLHTADERDAARSGELARPSGRLRAALDRVTGLPTEVRLAARRARFRRAGLEPRPVRPMTDEEIVAAERHLAEDDDPRWTV